jgi:hypothetical protein
MFLQTLLNYVTTTKMNLINFGVHTAKDQVQKLFLELIS